MFYIIILILFIILFKKNNNIKYLSHKEFINITNSSDYFQKMNKYDLKVRKCNTKEEYLKKYQSGYKHFNIIEQIILLYIVNIIDKKIKKFKKFKSIPWIFVKLNSTLENGYPHTLQNVIILPSNFFMNYSINTIIHEKVHIYQRIYYNYTEILYNLWGFTKVNINFDNNRNNPDLFNNYSYNNNLLIQLYNNNPNELYDSKPYLINLINNKKNIINKTIINDNNLPNIYINRLEHPNEIMAEMITLYITNNYNKNDKWFNNLDEWIKKYF